MNTTILPPESELYTLFAQIAAERQMVFLAGLPGAGKSLLLKQLVLLAQENGRTVHLLQWDVTRAAFETAEVLAKYPEIDGVTHAAIRKAVGLWARGAVWRWYEQYSGRAHILLGELPLIGNRLIELVQEHNDAAEAVLAAEGTLFLVPVPSKEVRQVIEGARAQSMAAPQHEKETKDAQPQVLQMIWQEVALLGYVLELAENDAAEMGVYDPAVYAAVYQRLLTHRHCQLLPIDTVLKPQGSAYDVVIKGAELAATAAEVVAIMTEIEQDYTAEELAAAVARWYEV